MATTTNRSYPKPDPVAVVPETVEEAFLLVKTFAEMVDVDVFNLLASVAGKAASVHGHAISDVSGLTAALTAKMDASATFNLDWLNDVSGTAGATDGWIMVKAPGGWTAASALSSLGSHSHAQSDVTGLVAALAAKADSSWVTTQINNVINAAPGVLDTIGEIATALGNDPNAITTIISSLALKAPLLSPAFTGAPTAPTAAPATNNGQIASTAYADAAAAAAAATAYGKVVRRVYLSGATWNKPAGLVKIIATPVAGGGGSGGHSNSTGTQKGGGGGGGGAAIKEILAASLGATETITIGAGGAAGNTSGSSGGTGGTTSFGAHVSATGGTGGGGVTSTGGAAGVGGLGSGGDINLRGQAGPSGSLARDFDVPGAASALGTGYAAHQPTSTSAGNAAPVNSGGGATGSGGNAKQADGGLGGSGFCIVEEYYV